MIPIRVKFDKYTQQFQLIEPYHGHLFEDGEDYCLVPDHPDSGADETGYDDLLM